MKEGGKVGEGKSGFVGEGESQSLSSQWFYYMDHNHKEWDWPQRPSFFVGKCILYIISVF